MLGIPFLGRMERTAIPNCLLGIITVLECQGAAISRSGCQIGSAHHGIVVFVLHRNETASDRPCTTFSDGKK